MAGSGTSSTSRATRRPASTPRAFVEGRLTEEQLDHFRQEVGGKGLPSYPHPRLLPDFWEYPTVSMGLGPLCAIYQAHVNRYLLHRELVDTSASRVWAFLGDGELDEVESIGALGVAGREHLDNLIFVVNCNLQRLDGPVRGNGKIIQEAEAMFRGAGWNVIKVIWGSKWDELLARDVDGVLLDKMNNTPDGEFQKYAIESGAYIREHFFGPDPRLRRLVEHLSDEELQALPRGGHDYRKLYAAYKLATEQVGQPTVILAKTVKGWTLGPEIEARNATHQIKKMTSAQLRVLRDRLYLQDEIPDDELIDDLPPYYRPPEGTPAHEYLAARRQVLAGPVPTRVVRRVAPSAPADGTFADLYAGSGKQAASTTMAFARLLRNLVRDPTMGRFVTPIVPDEARTFGLEPLIAEAKIYAPDGQRYTPVDADLILRYAEDKKGQVLEEGITEAGAMASFIALSTSYATWGAAHAADLPLLFDVRVPAHRRSRLAPRRHPGPRHPRRLHRGAHDAARRGTPARRRPLPAVGVGEPRGAHLRPRLRLRDRRDHGGGGPKHHGPRARGPLLVPDALQRELPDAAAPRG